MRGIFPKKGEVFVKTLVWNGSPRKNGSTYFLVSELSRRLCGEIRNIDVYREEIRPCVDCRACWKQAGCVQEDAMRKIYTDLEACDNIVIASPVYYSELTGPLLSALSRLQMYYAARRFLKMDLIPKPKRGAVILCGGGEGSARTAETTARCLLKQMNAETDAVISSLHTDETGSWDDLDALSQIQSLAAFWNGSSDAL